MASKMESSDQQNDDTMEGGESRKRGLDSDYEQHRTKRRHNTSDSVLLKQLIPQQLSGAVLGKGGVTITAMISETSTSIKMSNPRDFYPGSNDRVLSITGPAEQVKKAHNLVWEKLRERNESIDELKMKLVVPHCTVGMIMGKGGSYIKQVKERTGAFVVVSQKSPEPERVVTISGLNQNMSDAFDLIFDMIRDDPQSGSCPGINYSEYHGSSGTPNLTSPSYAYAGPLAASCVPMGARFDARSNDTLDTLKSTLHSAGNSAQATDEIAAAVFMLAQHGLCGVGANSGSVGGLSLQYMMSILSAQANVSSPMGGAGNMSGGNGSNGVFNARSNNGSRGFEMNATNNNGSSFNFGGRGSGSEAFAFGGANSFGGGGGGGNSFSTGASKFGGSLSAGQGGGESIEEEVHVSEAFVGAVLGPGGKALVEIQRTTGTTIAISNKGVFAEGTRNRIVTITGSRSAVNRAIQYVRENISQAEEKRARRDRMQQ